ncbi:MAG: flagellar protein [Lachnospiraceae bacterium]|nr:flagellar protein [Lachnospiraceae bacterium]
MELRNCRNCKKLFNYISGEPICPGCKKVLEDKFQEVKEYIRENPGVNANSVAEECDVSLKQIKKWVREERLTFSDDSLIGLECERCGKMIHSGRFCSSCAGGLSDALGNAYKKEVISVKKPEPRSGGKMRFLE